MITLPFVAVFAQLASKVYARWILRTLPVQPRTLLVVDFLLIAILMIGLMPFLGSIEHSFYTATALGFFFASVVLGIIGNLLDINALKKDSLRSYELIQVVGPIITMGLAALIFADEREPIRLAIGLLAAGSFALTHIESRHFLLTKTDTRLVFSVVLFAVEGMFSKIILTWLSPVSYYGLRAVVIALVIFLIFRPSLTKVGGPVWGHSVANMALAALRSVAALYSIHYFGIVTTQLILLTEPVLAALFSRMALRERWSLRQGVGFVVIFICILVLRVL